MDIDFTSFDSLTLISLIMAISDKIILGIEFENWSTLIWKGAIKFKKWLDYYDFPMKIQLA